jgi:hypothetical protein
MVEGVKYKKPLGGDCGSVKIVIWCGALWQGRYFGERTAVEKVGDSSGIDVDKSTLFCDCTAGGENRE